MIYDIIEAFFTVLNANLVTDFAALATTKSVANLSPAPKIIKRQDMETALRLNAYAVPLLTLDAAKATTQAKHQSRRHNIGAVTLEFYMRVAQASIVTMGQQTDLLPEAVMKSVDRLKDAGLNNVYGAGELPGSVPVEWLRNPYNIAPEGQFDRLVTMTIPVNQVDTGL